MSVTDIIMSDVTDKNYGKSGEKKLLTSCFLTPLVRAVNILIISKLVEIKIYS
jgi:hypothetical protein